MRDFSNKFRRPKPGALIKTTNRTFAVGLPSSAKTREAREIRRAKVWDLFLTGHSIAEIATIANCSASTVHSDIAKSRDMVRPLLIQDSLDHLAQFVSQKELIMRMAKQRIDRIYEIEDLMVDAAFGQQGKSDDWLNQAPEVDGKGRPKRRQQNDPSMINIKLESVAPLLGEMSKAASDIAAAKGVKGTGKDTNINIAIDMMTDDALIKALKEAGIEPKEIGIVIEGESRVIEEGKAELPLLSEGDDDELDPTDLVHLDGYWDQIGTEEDEE